MIWEKVTASTVCSSSCPVERKVPECGNIVKCWKADCVILADLDGWTVASTRDERTGENKKRKIEKQHSPIEPET